MNIEMAVRNQIDDYDWDAISFQMSPSEIGKRINTIRVGSNMSMETFALQLSKSRSTISRIERGAQELTLDQLFMLAEVLNVSCQELLGASKLEA